MKIANIFSSRTGNTGKVAEKINEAATELNHHVDMIQVEQNKGGIQILEYDFVFAGSGVYSCMPSEGMTRFMAELGAHGMKTGDIVLRAPRRPGKFAVIYCTYGGAHTGISEAVPCVKSIGQLFDHYGLEILDEWYTVGAFMPKGMAHFNTGGRLGNITGRPNHEDLDEIYEKTLGVLKSVDAVGVAEGI